MLISAHDIESFQRDGVIALRRAFSEEFIKILTDGVNAVLNSPAARSAFVPIGNQGQQIDNCFWGHLTTNEINKFIHQSPMKMIIKQLTQSDRCQFFYDQIISKPANTLQRTPWHRDSDYFPFTGSNNISIWIPLDTVSRESGSMGFIKGSQKCTNEELLNKAPQQNSADQEKVRYSLPDFDKFPELYETSSWELNIGDALVFDTRTCHFAHGNHSTTKQRRAISFRWLGEDAVASEEKFHILQHEKICDFLKRQSQSNDCSLDNPLFYKF